MYKAILLLSLSLGAKTSNAQSAELEQLTLDISKLAQLKSILQDMYSYYTILDKGYEDIKGIAKGNFNLHQTYMNGLLVPSPAVSSDPQVQAILQDQAQLLQAYDAIVAAFQADPHLTPAEVTRLTTVCTGVLQASAEDLNELAMVLTDGVLRMSDDERLTAIERIHRDITDRLAYLRSLATTVARVSASRRGRASDALTLQKLYGL